MGFYMSKITSISHGSYLLQSSGETTHRRKETGSFGKVVYGMLVTVKEVLVNFGDISSILLRTSILFLYLVFPPFMFNIL